MTVDIDDGQLQRTFQELQRIEQGKLHQLGDELLPWHDEMLAGLRPNGLNQEGKTRKGVPDSFVGDTATACRVAVEYSTQKTTIEKKFGGDYAGVRTACPLARYIVLCTNRSAAGVDVSVVRDEAVRDGVTLKIVDGNDLARILFDRQDLRYLFLGIPIGAHTANSLIGVTRDRLKVLTINKLPPGTSGCLVARPELDRMLADRTEQSPSGMTLVTAPAGMGKSTWSIVSATRQSGAHPVCWMAAVDLPLGDADPIGLAVVQACYGAPEPARMNELAELLRRERLVLRAYIDAIDESRDYQQFDRAVRMFRAGALGTHTHLILLCRSEAIAAVESTLGRSFPELFNRRSEAQITLDSLTEEESRVLLEKYGATRAEIRSIEGWLPSDYRGNPLFLLRSLYASRSGDLVTGSAAAVFSSLAEHFVRDIARRLKREGASPSLGRIRQFLEALALHILRNPRNEIAIDDVGKLPDGDEEGENTVVGRAVQSGLLLWLADGTALCFSHALFLEYFAAKGIERADATIWDQYLPSLATPMGLRVATRLAASLSDSNPLVRRILDQDEVAACEVAANTRSPLDPVLIDRLLAVAKRLLASRFPSDRARALRLLGGFKGKEAVSASVEWWHSLSADERRHWLDEAAELFLALQVPEAAAVICRHRGLSHPPGRPWYEPSFVRRLQALPVPFKESLQGVARKLLVATEATSHAYTRYLMLLAVLRDEWLVPYLQVQHSKGNLLGKEVHRALIFMNTPEAIELFADSVDRHINMLEGMHPSTASDNEGHRALLWHSIVSKTSDIPMYPHEHLLSLVKDALGSCRWIHVAFGIEWAARLNSPQLLPAYSAALARYPESWSALTKDMIKQLLRVLSFEQVRELYEANDVNVRKDIVRYLYEVPGNSTEEFLIQRLEESDYRLNAIQSLGLLHSSKAGPAIHRWMKDGDAKTQYAAMTALGRLRHRPALTDLAHQLEQLIAERKSNAAAGDKNLEYLLIGSIGQIGGEAAFAALARVFLDTYYPDQVLQVLVHSGTDEGIAQAHILLEAHSRARNFLVPAIVRDDYREGGHNLIEPVTPWLKDEVLLDYVLQYEHRVLPKGYLAAGENIIGAVAAFDLDRARRFLEAVAAGEAQLELSERDAQFGVEPSHEAQRILGSLGHPRYARAALDAALDRLEGQPWVSARDADSLRKWPTELVRETLLHRLEGDRATKKMLTLFQWFASLADRQVFERLERADNLELADVAHRYLIEPMQVL